MAAIKACSSGGLGLPALAICCLGWLFVIPMTPDTHTGPWAGQYLNYRPPDPLTAAHCPPCWVGNIPLPGIVTLAVGTLATES